MSFFTLITIFTLSVAISPVYAFTSTNNNKCTTAQPPESLVPSSVSCVIVVAILGFLCLARRRRARAGGPIIGGGFAPGGVGKPSRFGGAWGSGNTQNQNGAPWHNQNQAAYQPGGQQSYYPGGPSAAAGTKYPPAAAEPVPPPYTSGDTQQQPGMFSPEYTAVGSLRFGLDVD
ncbi:hypothetical protein B0H13DRAFT_2005846 [Mycena leptocephala]|nr:hypothetical protein B0H13DRAFT_2005846 [Mycena leptocephala]